MAIELVTFADLKAFLDLSDATENDYPDLALIKTSVVSAIENYCRRIFEHDEYTKTHFYLAPIKFIEVAAYPITSVVSLNLDSGDGDVLQTENTDFVVLNDGIEFSEPIQATKVTLVYNGGLQTVPGDLSRAALLQTVYEFQNKNSVGLENVNTQGGSVTKPELGLLKEVKKILDETYKRPNLSY